MASQHVKTVELHDFFSWLREEIQKANKFYTEQEKEAAGNVHTLREQVNQFLQHKKPVRKDRRQDILNQLDLPSLPLAFRGSSKTEREVGLSNDHGHGNHVSYFQARHMLRVALREQYLAIGHLRSYRALNLTAVRKVVKKMDKTVKVSTLDRVMRGLDNQNIGKSTRCDALALEIENLYAKAFEQGNHKHAVDSLTTSPSTRPHNFDVLLTGLSLGASVPLFLRALYAGIRTFLNGHADVWPLLQIWLGFLPIALMLLGMALNVVIWRLWRINYPFIFEFDRYTMLDWRQVGVLPSLLFFFMSLFAWISFDADSVLPNYSFSRYSFCIFLGISLLGLILPLPWFWQPSRKWLCHGLIRLILSGAYPVEFRDFFLGDLAISLNNSVSNLSYFLCVYGSDDWAASGTLCGSSYSHAMGFLSSLPGVWRFLQCLRRYGDSYDWFPHLLNAGKYSFTIIYNVTLSMSRISPNSIFLRTVFIICAAINGTYSAAWDIFMDFSLAGFDLRGLCVYPRWVYYVVIVLDPMMRQTWLLYVLVKDQRYVKWTSLIVGLIEVLRRILWANFRVENEHAANVSRYCAFRDLKLPYEEVSAEPSPTAIPIESISRHRPSILEPFKLNKLQLAHVRDFQRRRTEDDEDSDTESS